MLHYLIEDFIGRADRAQKGGLMSTSRVTKVCNEKKVLTAIEKPRGTKNEGKVVLPKLFCNDSSSDCSCSGLEKFAD